MKRLLVILTLAVTGLQPIAFSQINQRNMRVSVPASSLLVNAATLTMANGATATWNSSTGEVTIYTVGSGGGGSASVTTATNWLGAGAQGLWTTNFFLRQSGFSINGQPVTNGGNYTTSGGQPPSGVLSNLALGNGGGLVSNVTATGGVATDATKQPASGVLSNLALGNGAGLVSNVTATGGVATDATKQPASTILSNLALGNGADLISNVVDATARASAAAGQPVSGVLSNLNLGNGADLVSNVTATGGVATDATKQPASGVLSNLALGNGAGLVSNVTATGGVATDATKQPASGVLSNLSLGNGSGLVSNVVDHTKQPASGILSNLAAGGSSPLTFTNDLTLTGALNASGANLTSLSADNITSGTLSSSRLPTTGVSAGSYGSASQIPTFTVDASGRLTTAGSAAISGVGVATNAIGTLIYNGAANGNMTVLTIGPGLGLTVSGSTGTIINAENVVWNQARGTIVSGSTCVRAGADYRLAQFSDTSSTLFFFDQVLPGHWTNIQSMANWTAASSGVSTATLEVCSIACDGTTNVPTSFTVTNTVTVISGSAPYVSSLSTNIPGGCQTVRFRWLSGAPILLENTEWRFAP